MDTPLAFVERNKLFTIKEISNKLKEKSTLTEKGFCVGTKISLKECNNNNFIVEVNGSAYVIGFSFAKNIYVA